jgi:molybdopterin molybdotransferase
MISIEEAKKLLSGQVVRSVPVDVIIAQAAGCVLAEDIFSQIDLPSFNQSAMDGYAISSVEKNNNCFEVIGEIKAGEDSSLQLQSGQAVRIYTGAAVPASADTVVIQEKVEQTNGSVYLTDDFKKGDCIRLQGSQVKEGELALKKNKFLNPAAIGFLAALGVSTVKIFKKPDVSILVTGNEIVKPGNKIKPGEIFESNSFALDAALKQMGIPVKNIFSAADNKSELKNKIETCLQDSDVIVITGGISAGKYDLVFDALNELNVETIFYKVAQKPGKPFLFGKLNGKLIFALPGNPAAVLVCFYEYVYPAIRMIQGFENTTLPALKLKLLKQIIKKEDRGLFLRSKKMNDGVMPLDKQDSNMLGSFAEADSLIYIPNETKIIEAGDEVEVHLLPFN